MREHDYSARKALLKGDISTTLSFIIMGFGNIVHKQITKGLLFLLWEIFYIIFMAQYGVDYLVDLFNLGGEKGGEVWDEVNGCYINTPGDDSQLMLLYGVLVIFLTLSFIITWRTAVKSAYKAQLLSDNYQHVNTFKEDIKDLFDKNLHNLLLTGPILGIVVFSIIPLVFMILMAFTNYSIKDDHAVLFNWVGLENFSNLVNGTNDIGKQFFPVLAWTLIWAVCATFLNYFLGTIIAMIINRKRTRLKKFWRGCLVVTIAIPQFVSLLAVRQMLALNGPINQFLINHNVINDAIPFWTDVTWARITVIIVNLWIGIPFTMLQVTGILNNIPAELYEAAKIDGASKVVIFFKITLPYMLFVTAPYLITTFANNVNNFNVIYLLTGGSPDVVDGTAGKTDLLVTWLFKLTVNKAYYNEGAVIGILTFIVLATISLFTYRRTGSYKDEEGFQ